MKNIDALKQGDIRYWTVEPNIHNVRIKICGLAAAPQARIGQPYIVELLEPIPDYEYSHAVAFEVHLK
jgi:hypothetical protein